jgi:hypothetical protein
MAKKKKDVVAGTGKAVELAQVLFNEHTHVNTVWVNEETGDCYLHPKAGLVEVERSEKAEPAAE